MPPVLDAAWTGRRVVLRRTVDTPAGDAPGRDTVRYRDVLGDLVALSADRAEVITRTGRVEVPLGALASARLVQPAAGEVLALETVAARGWRAREVADSPDGWLLRADRGWTGRANSALARRTVRRPLDDVLTEVRAFYAARGLPARVQVPDPTAAALGVALGRRGWTGADHTDVLVSRVDLLINRTASAVDVRLDPAPDDDWLGAYHYRGRGPLPAGAVDLLTRHDRAVFARVTVDGAVAAIGRGALDVDEHGVGWLGLTAIDVAAAHRRRGLATAVVGALARWGAADGAVRAYVQSDRTNDAAHRLLEGLGCYPHHSYHYRTAPTID